MGEGFTLALTKQGELYSWGMNDKGQLGKEDLLPWIEPERV